MTYPLQPSTLLSSFNTAYYLSPNFFSLEFRKKRKKVPVDSSSLASLDLPYTHYSVWHRPTRNQNPEPMPWVPPVWLPVKG